MASLEYGVDEKLNLNAGIQLDDTLSKSGYAADASKVGELKSDLSHLSKEMIDVKGATVGQIIKVSAVDDTGKPTAWEPATPPSKLTDFKNDLYFSKEELFLALTKDDFEYDENRPGFIR